MLVICISCRDLFYHVVFAKISDNIMLLNRIIENNFIPNDINYLV